MGPADGQKPHRGVRTAGARPGPEPGQGPVRLRPEWKGASGRGNGGCSGAEARRKKRGEAGAGGGSQARAVLGQHPVRGVTPLAGGPGSQGGRLFWQSSGPEPRQGAGESKSRRREGQSFRILFTEVSPPVSGERSLLGGSVEGRGTPPQTLFEQEPVGVSPSGPRWSPGCLPRNAPVCAAPCPWRSHACVWAPWTAHVTSRSCAFLLFLLPANFTWSLGDTLTLKGL
ncbi:translation initiation factor IF-2-like [Lontra canadensis]|uniref:translation initiation factor IF-2-like n=1 Tax=Lontra canadensis TaxID=76717 RepID=UPI0013F363DB|nr:translation initiation factor IF-2-like [Lontra canadensis]